MTFFMWIRCRWVRVVASRAYWASLPHVIRAGSIACIVVAGAMLPPLAAIPAIPLAGESPTAEDYAPPALFIPGGLAPGQGVFAPNFIPAPGDFNEIRGQFAPLPAAAAPPSPEVEKPRIPEPAWLFFVGLGALWLLHQKGAASCKARISWRHQSTSSIWRRSGL